MPLAESVSRSSQELVLTPWQALLFREISEAQHEVLIASPFIKFGIATRVQGRHHLPRCGV